jgi:hypothetical protein
MEYSGRISAVEGSRLTLTLDRSALDDIERTEASTARVIIDDGRTISAEQRRKIYAMLRDISDWSGEEIEPLKMYFKNELAGEVDGIISLSSCTMEQANMFIDLLTDFALTWNVPMSEPLAINAANMDRYLYNCVKLRRCAITGRPDAHIHHITRVGMRKRNEICHVGMMVIALCPELHAKVHTEGGEDEFYKANHVHGIPLDGRLISILSIGKMPGEIVS